MFNILINASIFITLTIVIGNNRIDVLVVVNKSAKWLREHATLTRDFDYFNLSRFIHVKLKKFDELSNNFSIILNPLILILNPNTSISVLTLTLTDYKKLLIGYDLDLRMLLASFEFDNQYRVTFTNLKASI